MALIPGFAEGHAVFVHFKIFSVSGAKSSWFMLEVYQRPCTPKGILGRGKQEENGCGGEGRPGSDLGTLLSLGTLVSPPWAPGKRRNTKECVAPSWSSSHGWGQQSLLSQVPLGSLECVLGAGRGPTVQSEAPVRIQAEAGPIRLAPRPLEGGMGYLKAYPTDRENNTQCLQREITVSAPRHSPEPSTGKGLNGRLIYTLTIPQDNFKPGDKITLKEQTVDAFYSAREHGLVQQRCQFCVHLILCQWVLGSVAQACLTSWTALRSSSPVAHCLYTILRRCWVGEPPFPRSFTIPVFGGFTSACGEDWRKSAWTLEEEKEKPRGSRGIT